MLYVINPIYVKNLHSSTNQPDVVISRRNPIVFLVVKTLTYIIPFLILKDVVSVSPCCTYIAFWYHCCVVSPFSESILNRTCCTALVLPTKKNLLFDNADAAKQMKDWMLASGKVFTFNKFGQRVVYLIGSDSNGGHPHSFDQYSDYILSVNSPSNTVLSTDFSS